MEGLDERPRPTSRGKVCGAFKTEELRSSSLSKDGVGCPQHWETRLGYCVCVGGGDGKWGVVLVKSLLFLLNFRKIILHLN